MLARRTARWPGIISPMMRVLYDAWDWAYRPQSPAAWHLARVLQRLPEDIEPLLALPQPLAVAVPWPVQVVALPNSAWGRLRWEQWVLPRLARRHGVHLLHLFHGVPLVSPVPTVHEGALPAAPPQAPLALRLRMALARGGLSQPTTRHLGNDIDGRVTLPLPVNPPPALPDAKVPVRRYVVAYGPWDEEALGLLLRGWGWVAQSLGDDVALYLLGLDQDQHDLVTQWRREVPWETQIRTVPLAPWEALGALQRAEALLQVGWAPYREEVVGAALGLGVPIVGEERAPLPALLGPAGYLVPPGDHRALGGALIAVLVEEHLAADLRQRSLQRAQWWAQRGKAPGLAEVYRQTMAARHP